MAPNTVSVGLAGIEDQREADAAIRRLEDYATPAEFALANAVANLLTDAGQRALRRSYAGKYMRNQAAEPEPYARVALDTNVSLYRGPDGVPEDKTLVVAFAGAAQRLMVPICVALQCLPSARHDVVFARDPARNHFDLGAPGYAESLPATVQRLRTDLALERYSRVVTLGTSMGGFPALRAGVLLDADLAISLGGRPIWHINRLLDHRPDLSPFDLLCPCGPSGSELLLIYAADSEEDCQGADMVAKMRPAGRIVVPGSDHNAIRFVVAAGLADVFLPALVAGDLGVVRQILDSIFSQRAKEALARDIAAS